MIRPNIALEKLRQCRILTEEEETNVLAWTLHLERELGVARLNGLRPEDEALLARHGIRRCPYCKYRHDDPGDGCRECLEECSKEQEDAHLKEQEYNHKG